MGILVAVPGVVLAAFGLYLVTLAVAASRATARSTAPGEPASHVAVLVPAHDEAALVARCVASLRAQQYPAHLLRVVVVADNCSDETAAIAHEAGAEVMVRQEPDARGKGHALRWAFGLLLAEPQPPDAIVVVDADSVADPGLVRSLVAELEGGHEAVQADYEMLGERGPAAGEMARVGFLLFHRVRFSGRHRLGMAASLVGNGMLFSAQLLRRHPWDALTPAEDLEYSVRLRLNGIAPRFAPAARVWGPGPASDAGAVRQRVRWEGGRFHVVRTQLPRLLRAGLLDAALDLATPPLGMLSLAVIGGGVVAAALAIGGIAPRWALAPWLVAGAAIPAFVVIGLRAADAGDLAWVVLRRAPRFLAWKLTTYLRLTRTFDVSRWERTDRGVVS